jgi:CheY-like chemotaxis protein
MNLAVNARDAVDHGGRVSIETAQMMILDGDHGGPHVRLTVTDNGAGMSADVLPHIFDPFFTTKELGQGTGLGLSTVYGIVEEAHGFIQVDSEPAKGSSFEVYLPAITEQAGASAEEILLPGLSNSETVLVVEDQPEVRHFTTSVLESYGYRVLEASNGEEAVQVVERHAAAIALAVTDVVMPGMSSRELTDRLLAVLPDIKILYVSGYPASTSIDEDLLRPGTSYLAKPYSPERLVSKLRELVGEKRS